MPNRRIRRTHGKKKADRQVPDLKLKRLWTEQLESRLVLATFVVTNTNDAGSGSLRESLAMANANGEADTIVFDDSLSGQTVLLANGELEVRDSLTIDGSSLPERITIDAAQQSRVFNISNPDSFNDPFDATLISLTITGGHERSNPGGGGVQFNNPGSLSVHQTTISGNYAESSGGGIMVSRASSVMISDSTIAWNTSGRAGGGAFVVDSYDLMVTGSTINQNTTSYGGGGIIVRFSNATITGSTISGNIAAGYGGGIVMNGDRLDVTDSTITGNVSAYRGGGIYATSYSAVTLNNSILAGNEAPAAPDVSHDLLLPPVFSFSLLGDNTGTSFAPAAVGTPDAQGNLIGTAFDRIDPRLAPLGDNGGATRTHSLLPTSPAIDAGNTLESLDQRGAARLVDWLSIANNGTGNGSDMGSFELQSISGAFFPEFVMGQYNSTSEIDLSSSRIIDESGDLLTLNFGVDVGSFGPPADGTLVGVSATQVGAQEIEFVGTATNLNRYLSEASNLSYLPPTAAIGDSVATISLNLDNAMSNLFSDSIGIRIPGPLGFVVTTAEDVLNDLDSVTSIREAIRLANKSPGLDTISFAPELSGETIFLLGGQLSVHDAVVIDAQNLADGLTLDAMQQSRVLKIDDPRRDDEDFDVLLAGLNITNGSATSVGTVGGGGIYSVSHGVLTLEQTDVTNNHSPVGAGGGILAAEGSVTLSDSIVENNSSGKSGGGINAKIVSTSNSSVVNNRITATNRYLGGGIYAKESVTLSGTTVSSNNSGRGSGGGIFAETVDGTGNVISGNVSGEDGGGIWANFASLVDSSIHNNSAHRDGGGIRASVQLTSSSVTENFSGSSGGGISSRGRISLLDSMVDGNSSGEDGGGLATDNDVQISSSSITRNTSGGIGGGINTTDGTIASSTVSGNWSQDNAGGIYAKRGEVFIIDSTVTENHSGTGYGGGIFIDQGIFPPSVSIQNSIVAGNSARNAADFFPNPESPLDVRFSLIGDSSGTPLLPAPVGAPDAQGNFVGTPNNPIDPQLGPLSENGGPTLTHAILPGSPAFETGHSMASTDQRGLPRPVDFESVANPTRNGSDMGAFERQELESNFLTARVTVNFDSLSILDLSSTLFVDESGSTLTATFTVNDGMFGEPLDGTPLGVSAVQNDSQTIVLMGTAANLNHYLDQTANLTYAPPIGATGAGAANIEVLIFDGATSTSLGTVVVDVDEIGGTHVTTNSDTVDAGDFVTSLREAILFANRTEDESIVTFDNALSGQTILLNGELEISGPVVVDATSLSENITIDAQQNSRVISIVETEGTPAGFNVTLMGLTVTGGVTSESGGGIYAMNRGTLTIRDSVIRRNHSDFDGGAIYTHVGDLQIVQSAISGNSSILDGGGIYSFEGNVDLVESSVYANSSGQDGGGVQSRLGEVRLEQSAITDNHSGRDGGGIFSRFGDVFLNLSSLHGNTSFDDGGGIATLRGAITLTRSTASQNTRLCF